MARVVVCGYMIRFPLAGNVLAYMHYVLGLHRLGHEVLYLEESGWPDSCYDIHAREYTSDPGIGLGIVEQLLGRYGAHVPVCYVDRDRGPTTGMSWDEIKSALGHADLLLNVGGVCWLPEFRLCRRRVLVDMDPFFFQVGKFFGRHDEYHLHFTYGTRIGLPGCPIPTSGLQWRATVPPVIPEMWPGSTQPEAPLVARTGDGDPPFTTVASWDAYGPVTYQGEHYGQKSDEFLRMVELPGRTTKKLELAVSGGGPEIWQRFRASGWTIRDGGDVSTSHDAYQAYLSGSRGEFSVAKHAYVKTGCGWFSDRSVCYLASGRPVVVQDTGCRDWLETDRGVYMFSSPEEAVECLDRAAADLDADAAGLGLRARSLAGNVFGYRRVLSRLVDEAMGNAPARSFRDLVRSWQGP